MRILSTLILCLLLNLPAAAQFAGEEAPAVENTSDKTKPALGTWGIDLSARDESIAPGDDFFRHANGTWLENFEIPPDQVRYGSFIVLDEQSDERTRAIIEELASANHATGSIEQKISDYYRSYMDVETVNREGLEPLRPTLNLIDQATSSGDLVRLFGSSGREGLATPVARSIVIDRKNPDRYILTLTQSGLSLPDRDYYLDQDERFVTIREAFQAHVARMLTLAGSENAEEEAAAVLALETEMAEHHWPRTDLRDRDKTYNLYTREAFEEEFAGLDWDAFFSAGDYPDFDELIVSTPSAIDSLIDVIASTPLGTWKAYLTFHALKNHAAVLSEDIYDEYFDFFGTTLTGQPEQKERWKRAVSRVGDDQGLGEAIGQIYVQRHFPETSKQMMQELVENLRTAFRNRIEALDWMGEETKKEAFAKLESFNPKIGYPDKWRDFSSVEITSDDLMANVRALRIYFYDDQLSLLERPADKDRWFMTPQTVNAYYYSSWNEIVFPAAILQPPFFDPNADPAVNYGGIGAVIGHEMGHGFDDQGSKSDYAGVQRNWWTAEDRARFEERATALVKQYEQFEPVEGQRLNGQLTLGENIGDLGGLAIAYEAYKIATEGQDVPVLDGLTGDQRFFLSLAQIWQVKAREEYLLKQIKENPHSPAEFRVNGTVRNMDAWYDAFGVTEEHALYLPPEERVRIW